MRFVWQELVFLVGGWLLAVALLPTVFGEAKPEPSTSLLTSAVLTAYVGSFLSLRQYLSAVGVGASALLWWVLFVQGVSL